MKKTLSIVGMGGSAIDGFGHTDEVWGLNHAYVYGKCDRIVMADDFSDIVEVSRYYSIPWFQAFSDTPMLTKKYVEIGVKDGVYGYSGEVGGIATSGGELLNKSEVFDMEGTLPLMGTIDLRCTLSYAIAQAIMEDRFDCIQLWGVEIWEFGGTGAYGSQIPNVNDWLRIARDHGIKVTIPFQIVSKIMDGFRFK